MSFVRARIACEKKMFFRDTPITGQIVWKTIRTNQRVQQDCTDRYHLKHVRGLWKKEENISSDQMVLNRSIGNLSIESVVGCQD